MASNGTEAPKRPFRIWDADAKKDLPYRYYAIKANAHNAALIEVRWSKVGVTLEVYDKRTAKLLGTYSRKLHTIAILKG